MTKGVWYDAQYKRWRARRYHNRQVYLVGYFKTEKEAVDAIAALDATLATTTPSRAATSLAPVSMAEKAQALRSQR